jgi:DHA1 family tetracycline resistance protein-like MFS transporter
LDKESAAAGRRRSRGPNPLAILFFIALVDVLGFGIIIPLLPYIGLRLGASPQFITPIMASYSFCQFLSAPFWGRLSDRHGRRPILMCALLGLGLSYLALARSGSLAMLVGARLFGGLMAGNISAAMAYASDVSRPENRARSLGLIGAAIGIGFALGPAIGGLLVGDDPASANLTRPAFLSAAFSFLAFLGVWLLLPESRKSGQRAERRESRFTLLIARPRLLRIVGATLLLTFAAGIVESIAILWSHDRFGFGPRSAGFLMLSIAVCAILMQGAGVARLVPLFGERRLGAIGATVYACGLLLVAVSSNFAIAALGLGICGFGGGAFVPCAASLASQQASPEERGAVLGTYQSAQSLARILGPLVSGAVYQHVGPTAPFFLAVAAVLPAAVLIGGVRSALSSETSRVKE